MQNIRKASGGAAPSGIPYSTSIITLAGFNNTNVEVDRTSPINVTKRTAFGFPNEWGNVGNLGYDVFLYRTSNTDPNETWSIILQQLGEEGFGTVTCATNPSTTLTEIPTTGWTLEPGVTGTITITAA